jgi:pimeloyl-ACP methyl ester carboxylesterase
MAQYLTVMPDIDITSLLPHIQAPTLVVAGERDPTVSPDESRKIASLVTNAELAIIPGAGHLSFLERPPAYQAALSAWLKKTD